MNFNKRSGTEDLGCMQINSAWLADSRLSARGITRDKLLTDRCLNVKVGAWILSSNLDRVGDNWDGVGSYNAGCKKLSKVECDRIRRTYAWRVYKAMNPAHGNSAVREKADLAASPAMVREPVGLQSSDVHSSGQTPSGRRRINTELAGNSPRIITVSFQ